MIHSLKISGSKGYVGVFSEYHLACREAIYIVAKDNALSVDIYTKKRLRFHKSGTVNKDNIKRHIIRQYAVSYLSIGTDMYFFKQQFGGDSQSHIAIMQTQPKKINIEGADITPIKYDEKTLTLEGYYYNYRISAKKAFISRLVELAIYLLPLQKEYLCTHN